MLKSKNTYLIKLFCFLLLLIILQSCRDKAGTWRNEQIKPGKRADFHELNDDVIKLLKANDAKGLVHFFCKELNGRQHIGRLVEMAGNELNNNKYTLLDEYYVINKYVDQDTIKATGTGINRYGLSYPGTGREMYMAFFVPKNGANRQMISLIYAKYYYGWKVSELDMGQYTINGKTAPQLFKLAKENYARHYLIDAVNNLELAITCLSPSTIWQYPEQDEMHDLDGKLITEANDIYKFPFVLTQVATKPKIIKVYNKTIDEGSFPVIYYLSGIKLADTIAIKKENDQVKQVIGTVMPGIDKGKKYLFYAVYNERPSYQKSVDHFDVMDKLKQ